MEKINSVMAVYAADPQADEAPSAFQSTGLHFVLVAHGAADDLSTEKRILERTSPLSLDEHRAAAPSEFRRVTNGGAPQ